MINLNLKKKKCFVQLGCTLLLAAAAGTASAALENESNDIFADANFADPGVNSGVIGDLTGFSNDADFWRFDLTAGSAFTAALSNGPAADVTSGFDLQAIMVLYLENDGKYYAVAGDRSDPGQASAEIGFTPWESGTYYLTLSGNGNAPVSKAGFLSEESNFQLVEGAALSFVYELSHFQGNGFVSFDYNLNLSGAVTTTPSAVPVPAAAWLFGSGLLGLVGIARRKSQTI